MVTTRNVRGRAKLLAAVTAVTLAVLAPIARTDVVIPATVYRGGVNNALFVSDVRLFNPNTFPVSVVPVFYDQTGGGTIEKPGFTIPPRQQVAYDNILQSLFGLGVGPFGPVRFRVSAPLLVSSGVNNQNGCGNGSISGQWLPGIDEAQALTSGLLVQLGSSANQATGYRTNVDFVSVGQPAQVSVTIHKGDGSVLAAQIVSVPANGLFQRPIADFSGAGGTTDTNLWLEFSSDVPVLAFASVINNASGDPFAIVGTAPPADVPVARFAFAPSSPAPGQEVTFTDESEGVLGALQLWAFGDGATAESGATAVHTYDAPGTYKASHFVANAAGVSSETKDVVVAAPVTPTPTAAAASPTPTATPTRTPTATPSGPTVIDIEAKRWTFEPNTVTLKVGQTYTIRFVASDVRHGVGGLAFLGITGCNLTLPNVPCSTTIKPTAQQVGTYDYSCTQTDCGAGHNTMTGTIVVEN